MTNFEKSKIGFCDLQVNIEINGFNPECIPKFYELLKIASTPNFYNSEIDGFPELHELFVDEDSNPCLVIDENSYKNLLTNSKHELNFNNIKSWAYLPVRTKA